MEVAVVTGASKGIGASIAEHLAAPGASVVVNYASSRSAADGQAIAVQADVSRRDQVGALFAEAKRVHGTLDVLVNKCGYLRI